MIHVPMLFVALGSIATGCAGDCLPTDPRCDVNWPAGRLTVVVPFDPPRVETTDEGATLAIWRGRGDIVVDHGTDWSADAVGDRVVIGVPDTDGVYVVDPADPGVVPSAPSLQGARRFGEVVKAIPQNGSTTLFVGAPGANLDRGAIYRYPDAENQLPTPPPAELPEPDLVIVGATPNDRLGANLEVCGDIDGDGTPDLVVGAPTFQLAACGLVDEAPPSLAGAVFVLRSSQLAADLGEVSICDLDVDVLWGTELGEGAGTSVACGPAAVYVGAPWHGLRGEDDQNAGMVYRVPWTSLPGAGSLDSLGTTRAGPRAEASYGLAVETMSIAGRTAVLVGAPGFTASETGSRRGLVELLVEEDGALGRVATVSGLEDGEQFGRTILAADLDGDSTDDVVLGSPDIALDGPLDVGRLWLWPGTDVETWTGEIDRGSARQIIEGTHAFQRVGRKLSHTTLQGSPVLLVPTRARPVTR